MKQLIGSHDDFTTAMAQHEDKLVVIKFYDQFCRACDEIRPRFEDLSHSVPDEDAAFFELEVRIHLVCLARVAGFEIPLSLIVCLKTWRAAAATLVPDFFRRVCTIRLTCWCGRPYWNNLPAALSADIASRCGCPPPICLYFTCARISLCRARRLCSSPELRTCASSSASGDYQPFRSTMAQPAGEQN